MLSIWVKRLMMNWSNRELEQVDRKEVTHPFFVRIQGNREERLPEVLETFANSKVVTVPELTGEFGFVTECISEAEFRRRQQSWRVFSEEFASEHKGVEI